MSNQIVDQESSGQAQNRTLLERGASLVEYAMLVGLIAVVCLAALSSFGEENDGLIQGSANDIIAANP